MLSRDEEIILLGEDICDPYGGAFNITQGLSTDFPERVLNTPISEGGIIGLATGMALEGFRPVVEIMFGDFMTLCFDQILNHLTKLHGMGKKVPVTIRTPMGGGFGYGMSHSQSLEKHFFGIPYLKVIAPSIYHNPYMLLREAVYDDAPVLFIEHKGLYKKKWHNKVYPSGFQYPMAYGREEWEPFGAECIIYAYGGMSIIADQVSKMFPKNVVKVYCPCWVNDRTFSHTSAPAVIIDPGAGGFGWAEHLMKFCHGEYIIVSGADTYIPANAREKDVLPNVAKVKEAVETLIGG